MRKLTILLLLITVGLQAQSKDLLGSSIDEVSALYSNNECMKLIEFTFDSESREFIMIWASNGTGDCEGNVTPTTDYYVFNLWGGLFHYKSITTFSYGTLIHGPYNPIEKYKNNPLYTELDGGLYRKVLDNGSEIVAQKWDGNHGSDRGYEFVIEQYDSHHNWKWAEAPENVWQYLENNGDTSVFEDGVLKQSLKKEPTNIKLHF